MKKLLAIGAGAMIGILPFVTPASASATLTRVYVTGYTWYDNTPPGSGAISNPVIHRTAGGIGTYANPITVAVGHSIIGGRDILDIPAGTRLYFRHLRRYGIVEDTCGDGSRPQNGPCHALGEAPRGARLWLDIYIGGTAADRESAVQDCASQITDGDGHELRTVIRNPARGLSVIAHPIFYRGHCG